jgi:hypothetical protein
MIANAAIVTLARQRAIKAAKLQFQRQGLKPSHFAHRDIVVAAEDYLSNHTELIADARETIQRWLAEGVFGKRAQRAWRATLNTHAQKPKA